MANNKIDAIKNGSNKFEVGTVSAIKDFIIQSLV